MFEQMRVNKRSLSSQNASRRARLHAAIDDRKEVTVSLHRLSTGQWAHVVLLPSGEIELWEDIGAGDFHRALGENGLMSESPEELEPGPWCDPD